MTNRGSVSRGAFVSLLCASALLAAEDDKTVPADFKIVAQYGAGYSDWNSWRHTITGDGKVVKEVLTIKDTKEESKLSDDDLKALIAKVREADFFKLKERYEYEVTDNPTLILTVTLDGRTHKVSVYAPSHLKDDKEVKRFFKAWSEVLRKVPSPNPDQKPDPYKP
jgi:hypothetical protein